MHAKRNRRSKPNRPVRGSSLSGLHGRPSANADCHSIEHGHVPEAEAQTQTQTQTESESVSGQLHTRHQAQVLRSVATFLEPETLELAALALVGELQQRHSAERAMLGLHNGQATRLVAISQQSRINRRATEVPLIERAMEEALQREQPVTSRGDVMPDVPNALAHDALLVGSTDSQLVSLPLFHRHEAVGVLTIESARNHPSSDDIESALQPIADMLSPLIAMRLDAERSASDRLKRRWRRTIDGCIGERQLRGVTAATTCVALLLLASVMSIEQEVVADATVTPIERRLVTAPFSGFVSKIVASPGEHVEKGELLLKLDRRDLNLQRSQWQTDLDGTSAELRQAMANHDYPEVAVQRARRGQAAAEVQRIDRQLSRADVSAPIAGIVAGSAFEELEGQPVERGELLVELASAEGYEVEILVNEADMSLVEGEPSGELSLTASPEDRHRFTLSRVHPIAIASNGQTRFRLNATLESPPDNLLPGQTGVARITVGRASPLHVHSRDFVMWCKQRWWEWFG